MDRLGANATATIQARSVYQVKLDWSGRELASACTRPHFAEGWFCKHLVALGLAVLDDAPVAPAPAVDHVDAWLDSLDAEALRDLVRELAARAPAAERLLDIRASAGGPGAEEAAKALASSVSDALRVRGFVDYRRSFEVSRDAQAVLDELERHLDTGAADAVRPAPLRALTRLRSLTLQADDSAGMLGDACQRAADLHARSCRQGRPDGRKLARWPAKVPRRVAGLAADAAVGLRRRVRQEGDRGLPQGGGGAGRAVRRRRPLEAVRGRPDAAGAGRARR